MLARQPRIAVAAGSGSAAGSNDSSPANLVDWLIELMRAELASRVLAIEEVASTARMSVRSLQRELATAGSSFRNVQQRVKLDRAIELLGQSGVTIRDVSTAVGFRDPAHFIRFFRRHAGVTPSEFRTARASN
jgi:transcriptional regulator GlxA family with amidase domain